MPLFWLVHQVDDIRVVRLEELRRATGRTLTLDEAGRIDRLA